MKNKKGFTLVELLGVIVILTILALVAGSSIVKVLKNSKADLNEVQLKSIELAAHTLAEENIDYIPSENECKYITLEDLDDYGLLKDDIKDLVTNQKIDNVYVKVCSTLSPLNSNISTTYEIKYMEEDGHPEDGLNPFFLAEPDLYHDTLVPIVYVEFKNGDPSYRKIIVNNDASENCGECYYRWQIPKDTDIWYDYDNQMWANAAVLRSGVSKDPETILNLTTDETSDILQMYVWIPRYSYTIKDSYGRYIDGVGASTNVSKSTPGAIDIKFTPVNKTLKGTPQYTGDKPTGWYTMTAYSLEEQDGSITEINGIWVGKFEVSYTDPSLNGTSNFLKNYNDAYNNIRILPNRIALLYNNCYSLYYKIKAMTNSDNIYNFNSNIIDPHMIKNDEWDAAAYLSQSIFGKYGNKNFSGESKEVYKNNSTEHYTGKSSGIYFKELKESNEGSYSYDDLVDGTGASTTGSIYGIYDMSGGSYDKVMAYSRKASSGFNDEQLNSLGKKYANKIEEDENFYYDAKSWYNDAAYAKTIKDGTYKYWILRGYEIKESNESGLSVIGVFAIVRSNGGNGATSSTRIALFKKTN